MYEIMGIVQMIWRVFLNVRSSLFFSSKTLKPSIRPSRKIQRHSQRILTSSSKILRFLYERDGYVDDEWDYRFWFVKYLSQLPCLVFESALIVRDMVIRQHLRSSKLL